MDTTAKTRVPLLAVALATLTWLLGYPVHMQAVTDPGQVGPCVWSTQTVSIGGSLETDLYYPADATCGTGLGAPYPGLAFAHGWSIFGWSDGPAENAGNGQHLASWGYVVAIPTLADDAEERIAQMADVLDYLEQQATVPSSVLFQRVDTERLAVVGYSLGGATVLALTARDARVKAVVALDPVYHEGGPSGEGDPVWDPGAEAPSIAVPTGILGAPPSTCNADSDYLDIYPLVGAVHKASFRLVGASHCDFPDPGNAFCGFTCGAADASRTRLSQKYMTAWLNYYLQLQPEYYAYLFGAQAEADVAAGTIERQVDTAPRGLEASGGIGSIVVNWELYSHPVVAGYNIYRRAPGTSYGTTPDAQVGPVSSYTDSGVMNGQVYSYTICSRDPAGNPHGLAAEISAVAIDPESLDEHVFAPLIIKHAP
jgi:dienelactone hydrolase